MQQMQRMDYSIHPLLWERAGVDEAFTQPPMISFPSLPFQMFLLVLLVLGNSQSMTKLPSVTLLVTELSL